MGDGGMGRSVLEARAASGAAPDAALVAGGDAGAEETLDETAVVGDAAVEDEDASSLLPKAAMESSP